MSLTNLSHLARLDQYLIQVHAKQVHHPLVHAFLELFFFTVKEARACLFAGLFFISVFCVPKMGIFGLPRYDVLLIIAVGIQAMMLWTQLETWDEFKAICVFHVVGFVLEAFKVSSHIASWSYPDFAYTKLLGVPLFAGFMYAAVGSYIIQAWRLFQLRIIHHPPYWMAGLLASLIYLNFFTHHFIGDYRWYLAACTLGLYARATVLFTPFGRERKMPLVLAFILIGFFIWVAENISTLLGVWQYPNQVGAWAMVHMGKWSSWTLLVIISVTLTANLKHLRESIEVPK
jgi:uncharacterized membrane protein YoaT (DUF817 family)